jgi:hypothetical protein
LTEAEWLGWGSPWLPPGSLPGYTPRKFWLSMAAAIPKVGRRHFCEFCQCAIPILELASEEPQIWPSTWESIATRHPPSPDPGGGCLFRHFWRTPKHYCRGIITLIEAYNQILDHICHVNDERRRAEARGIVGQERVAAFIQADLAIISAEQQEATALLRDVLGNPFRPVIVEPSWRSSNVVTLARAIYDERAFDRMPILADALEDAGCTNPDILDHCRQPGEHVRGCWLVDLVLGKN